MIIKQTRIRTGGTSTALDYIQAMGENEDVELLYGDPSSLARFVNTMSSMNNHAFVLRHFIISPEQELNDVQIERCIEAIQDEFDTGDRPYVVARHKKIRADENDASHIHIMMAESNTSGRVLTNKNNYKRNEKICRNLELEFGLKIVQGRHNKFAVMNTEDKDAQSALTDSGIMDGDLPMAAYTNAMRAKARKCNLDLPSFHLALKAVKSINIDNPRERAEFIVKKLLDADVSIKEGKKKGVLVLFKDDVELGSLERLSKLSKNEISDIGPHLKSIGEFYEQNGRAEIRRNREYSQSNPIYYGRGQPAYRWPYSAGGDSRAVARNPDTSARRLEAFAGNYKISPRLLAKSGYMANLQGLTRRRLAKGIKPTAGGSYGASAPSSGAGPVITDVFNDGDAALRAATKSIEQPGA